MQVQLPELAEPYRWVLTHTLRKVLTYLKAHDPGTWEHSCQVGKYCHALATALGFSAGEAERIAAAGVLHDVGKLSVPVAILNKPGPLVEKEWQIIRQHPESGAVFLRHFGSIDKLFIAACRSHHESWDGSGYPDRLAGEGIPMVARIVAVADVLEAMTAPRSYQKPVSQLEAIELMMAMKGKFDPSILGVARKIFVGRGGIPPQCYKPLATMSL